MSIQPLSAPVGVGLYGTNGHQIHNLLVDHPQARLVAVCGIPDDRLPPKFGNDPAIRRHDTLDALIADPAVRVVALCSPRRDRQAGDALAALARGKHVYAEKPCGLSVTELETLLAADRAGTARFREMGGTCFENPWYSLRSLVQSGALGTVVQVHVQKSYPWRPTRSADPGVDGGLMPWVAVHAIRMVEQIGNIPIAGVVSAAQTGLGDPGGTGLVMAGAALFRLGNGGIATVTANYLNPDAFPTWGNETVRVFGTDGMAEIVDGGRRTRWVAKDHDHGDIPTVPPPPEYFSAWIASLLGGPSLELTLEEELHATRMALLARDKAMSVAR